MALEQLQDIAGDGIGTRVGSCGASLQLTGGGHALRDGCGVGDGSDARFHHGDGTGCGGALHDGRGVSDSPGALPEDRIDDPEPDLSDDTGWSDADGQGDGASDRVPDAWLAAHHLALEHDLARLPRALRAQLAQQHAPSWAVALDLARTHGLRTLASTGLPSR